MGSRSTTVDRDVAAARMPWIPVRDPRQRPATRRAGASDDPGASSGRALDTRGDGDGLSADLRGCRVLVVDDNRDGADSLALMLELIGAVTAVAYDGTSALRQLDAFNPQVVLLDLTLPDIAGNDIAGMMRQRQGGHQLLLVAVTGWGRAEDRSRSLAAGFDHHLVKPVEVQTIQALLANDPRACRSHDSAGER